MSVVGSAAIVFGLGGCSLIEPQGTVVPLSGIASCAQGHTWQLDMAKLAEDVKANIGAQGVAAEVASDGMQTMTWGIDGAVVIDSAYTLTMTTVPAEGQLQTVTTTTPARLPAPHTSTRTWQSRATGMRPAPSSRRSQI